MQAVFFTLKHIFKTSNPQVLDVAKKLHSKDMCCAIFVIGSQKT